MIFRRVVGERHIRIFYGSDSVSRVRPVVEEFQRLHSSEGTDLIRISSFASNKIWGQGRPIYAIVSDIEIVDFELANNIQDHILGIVLLRAHTILGIPTGFVETSDLSGYGAVIGPIENRTEIMQLAANAITSTVVSHTLRARYQTRADLHGDSYVLEWHHCRMIAMGQHRRNRLHMPESLEDLLSLFSPKTRKNLRYYRKKLESEHDCSFLASLDEPQIDQAIEQLRTSGKRTVERGFAERMGRLFRPENGGFSAGLCDHAGNWLSLIAGFHRGATCYIVWQLNRELDGHSVSSAMRLHFIENAITEQTRTIIFVGGTWGIWDRLCEVDEFTDFLAFNKNVVGVAARRLVLRMQPDSRMAALYKRFIACDRRPGMPDNRFRPSSHG